MLQAVGNCTTKPDVPPVTIAFSLKGLVKWAFLLILFAGYYN